MTLQEWINDHINDEVVVDKDGTISLKNNKTYYFLDAFGDIYEYTGPIDNESYRMRKEIGNIFDTKEDAILARDSLKVYGWMKMMGGRPFDKDKENFAICYSKAIDDLDVFEDNRYSHSIFNLYFGFEDRAVEVMRDLKKHFGDFMKLTIGERY